MAPVETIATIATSTASAAGQVCFLLLACDCVAENLHAFH